MHTFRKSPCISTFARQNNGIVIGIRKKFIISFIEMDPEKHVGLGVLVDLNDVAVLQWKNYVVVRNEYLCVSFCVG